MVNGELVAAGLLLLASLAVAAPSTPEFAAGRLRKVTGHRRAGRSRRPFPWPGRATPSSPALTPFDIELVAACLDAGAAPAAALTAAGGHVSGPGAAILARAGEALSAGADAQEALPEGGPLAPLAAVFRRSSLTGSAMSEQLVAIAAQLRADAHYERLAKAQRVGVMSALPLGLCLLPAFLLLAVAPAVLGLGAGLLR